MLTLPGNKVRIRRQGAYDPFWHLHHALFWGDGDFVFAHTAYFDDSGKKQQSLLVVGGYIASVRRWEQDFNPAWRLLLARNRMREFKRERFGPKPPRKQWMLLMEFARIINDYTLHAFACGIVIADWKRANEKYPMTRLNLYPYPICARTCVKHVRDWCRENGYARDQVQYVFDKGSQDSKYFDQLLAIDRDPEVRQIVPIPALSHKVYPIQSADYVAWETRRQMVDDPDATIPSISVRRLLRVPARRTVTIYRFSDLENMCRAANLPTREEMRKEKIRLRKPLLD